MQDSQSKGYYFGNNNDFQVEENIIPNLNTNVINQRLQKRKHKMIL